MDTEDGLVFVKNLAYFVRTHEKALANALQLQRQDVKHGHSSSMSGSSPTSGTAQPATGSLLSLPYFNFGSSRLKPAKLTLTPHHLYYLLSRFEELSILVGQMNIRLEDLHTDASPTNYVSFLGQSNRMGGRGADRDSIHSVSSVRSVLTGMTSFWSGFGLAANSTAKSDKQKAVEKDDLRYLYSAFTKIPCLRLAPDHKARLIAGYEEFPFDTAVPLFAFKNLSALEIHDVDFRQFYGWDRLADQLRSLTVKRAAVDDVGDVILNIVLDDMDKRRRRSAKSSSPSVPVATPSTSSRPSELARSESVPASPMSPIRRNSLGSPQSGTLMRAGSTSSKIPGRHRQRSPSPSRPPSSRHGSSLGHVRGAPRIRRSSGSSGSSVKTNTPRGSMSNLLAGILPAHKWRFLRHLSLADNGLTGVSSTSLMPLTSTLQSLDLSSNLFTEIPDSLAALTSLRALNLSNCMIESLHSLTLSPLPAITTLNLRGNRLMSLAGVERLLSLERVDFRDNRLTDPTELARLTGIPEIREVFVCRNPFVKTHSNYRVTIFNLFRKTPGYTEDILVDTSGPGYAERKQLIDRVPERASVPVMKPPPEDEAHPPRISVSTISAEQPTPASPTDARHAPSSPTRTRSDYVVQSHRKRKGPKRRIVELSQQELAAQQYAPADATMSPPDVTQAEVDGPNPTGAGIHLSNGSPKSMGRQEVSSLETGSLDALSQLSPTSKPAFAANGDTYKKKIEALRTDFGPGWLSALGDDGWEANQRPSPLERSFVGDESMRPPVKTRATSQGIASGGRTLG